MSEPNGNTLSGFGKDPLATSHGDALLDQNFQSLKSKEVRDSMSPTHELKFHSMSLTQPNTTGWDVQTSSEVSPDGRAYRSETVAKTDGVEKLNGGGVAEFKGRNEQRSSASHQGDDKNFVKQAAESSNTHLQEKVVFGDENSGRTEMKMSSTTSSSSSKFVSSSSTVEYGDDDVPHAAGKPRYLLDGASQVAKEEQRFQQQLQEQRQREERNFQEQRLREEQRFQEQLIQEQRIQEQRIQEQRQEQRQEERYTESREQSNKTRNVETQQHHEENKRYVDMDKASPEYQRHVQHLMSQPGEIISNTVEYPKPNVKMITTVKRLPDGTIVKNKRYETEQVQPTQSQTQTHQTQTHAQTKTHNQTHNQNQNQTQTQSQRDVVDGAVRSVRPVAHDVVQQESYSSVKKSSRRFSTETTSETIEEYDDRTPQGSPQKLKAPAPAQGFPAVKPHKPTQEFPGQRPTTPQSPHHHAPQPSRQSPSSDFSTHGFPSVKSHKPTQEFLSQRPVTAGGEEIIVVKSEQSRNIKQSSSTQRTTETQYITDEHGAPAAIQPSGEKVPPSVRRAPLEDQPDADLVHHHQQLQQQQQHHSTTSRKSNTTEHIIETQLEQDVVEPDQQQRRRPQPLQTQPQPAAGQRRSQPREDYSTHGFPSARSPTRSTPTRSPISKSPPRKPTTSTPGRTGTSTTKETTTSSTSNTITRRQLQKEREVDAAHRAFAASLRSSSPADSTTSSGSHPQPRRDSGQTVDHHQRLTPRSSVSSSRTYRRDAREGSHDSQAPSESSRISSTTVTRHVGPPSSTTHSSTTTKTVGKQQVVVNKQKTTEHSKSPTAAMTTTSTTTTTVETSPVTAPRPGSNIPSSPKTKPHYVDNDAPTPARRSSKSPSVERRTVQRETTFETSSVEHEFLPEQVTHIDDQIIIDESIITRPKGADKPRKSPEKSLPTDLPRQSPHSPTKLHATVPTKGAPKDLPSFGSPEKQLPKESPRQSPEKQQPGTAPWKSSPKDAPTSPNKQQTGTAPWKSSLKDEPRDRSPDKQQPGGPKDSLRQTPEQQLPKLAPWKTAPFEAPASPEREVPGIVPKDLTRESPERQQPGTAPSKSFSEDVFANIPKDKPQAGSPDKPTPGVSPKDSTRQTPEKQLPKLAPWKTAPYEVPSSPERELPGVVPKDSTRQSPERQQPGSAPWKTSPRDVPTSPEKQQPSTTQWKTSPKDEPSVGSPDKQQPGSKPNDTTRQSPEPQLPKLAPWKTAPYEIPASPEREVPGSIIRKDSPRQSPERQQPNAVSWKSSPSDEPTIPKKQTPSKGTKESPRQTPEKQLPGSPKDAPSSIPKGQQSKFPKDSPRQTPEKQLPETVSWKSSPKDLPHGSSLDRTFAKPKELPRQPSDKQSPLKQKDEPTPSNLNDRPRQSPERSPNAPQSKPDKQQPSQFREDALFLSTQKVTKQVTNTTKNFNEEFITNERQTQPGRKAPEPENLLDSDKPTTSETPDGGFISKSPEPEDNKPCYRKKGLSRRETFEDRCRKILGMEEDGDTQGNYTQKSQEDVDDDDTDEDVEDIENHETTTVRKETETFEFKIEDCPDDDDEDKKPRQITETYVVRTQPVIKVEEPQSEPESAVHHRSEWTVDVTESEEIETVATKKTVDKKTPLVEKPHPAGSRQPKDKPISDKPSKDDVEPQPKEPQSRSAAGKPSKPVNDDAELRPVTRKPSGDEEEPYPTPKFDKEARSKPAAGKPSKPTREDDEPRPVGRKPSKDAAKPCPVSGKPTWDEEQPRPAAGKPSKPTAEEPRSAPKYKKEPRPADDNPIEDEDHPWPAAGKPSKPSRDEEDLLPAARRPSRDRAVGGKPTWDEEQPRPAAGKPSAPKNEKEPRGKQPTEDQPRPGTGRQPKDEFAPRGHPKDDVETVTVNEETTIVITKRPSKSPSPQGRKSTSKSPSPTRREPADKPESPHFVTEKIIDCNGKTVVEKTSKTTTIGTTVGPKKKQPLDNEPEELQSRPETKKPQTTKTETERRNSRTTKTNNSNITTTTTTNKQTGKITRKESLPRREPTKRDSQVEETRTTQTTTVRNTTVRDKKPQPTDNSPTIKDRLRSSPRKQKPHPDDIDGKSSSSPDTSPNRVPSERRRSSNISVHTEIIIDHMSPKMERKAPQPAAPSPIRKLPVTERKESAPVPRVTRRDKDKVTRSTSENVIKVVNGTKPTPEMSTLNPNSAQRIPERNRPSKCFTTKTINLSEQLIHSEDMENVIIDIQHAKSSREPSPDRIVPTPVPAELDTGKPRYPDVVQEPEDEPRKKPVVTNIPIFEEEANAYVGCQISEIRNANGIEADIHDTPTVEAPKSLDYPSIDTDECLLSVHEKVSKFTHTAEQVLQPKTSAPFSREFDEHAKVSASDECLLSIDQKVDRFLKTAETVVTKPTREIERPNYEDVDEELRRDDCTLSVSQKVHKFIDTAEKLAPTAPQQSPRLVANIERHISRQSEPQLEQESEPEHPLDSESEVEPVLQPESDDELQPMSKHHTTAIELKRQKDILNRPSVFGQRPADRKPAGTTPSTTKQPRGSPSTALITEERRSYRNQQTHVGSPSPTPRSPTRNTTAPRKPVEQPQKQPQRNKPATSETETRRNGNHSTTSSSTTKRMEHITEQQWVISDVDVDVEEVGSTTAYHSPTSPGKRTPSSSTITSRPAKSPTTGEFSPRSTTPGQQSPNPTSPGRRITTSSTTTTTTKSTTSNTDLEKPGTRQPGTGRRTINKPTTVEPSSGPRTTPASHSPQQAMSPGRRPTTTSTTTTNGTTKPNNSSTVVKATTIEHSTTKHTTNKRTHSPTNQETTPDSSSTDCATEPLLERSRPSQTPTPTPITTATTTSTLTTSTTQSPTGRTVASRRNIFEKHSPSPPGSTTAEPATGRRPSYMDHTKSSLEHIRRDSLEVNKTHYSRKSSIEDDTTLEQRNPNAAVKFDVPRRSTSRPEPNEELDDIEQIFDLVQLEQLLETVTSYELRRRIRAQMRLIRKNMINAGTTGSITTTTTVTTRRTQEPLQPRVGSTTSTPSRSPLPPRRTVEQPRDRSVSPDSKVRTTSTTSPSTRSPLMQRRTPEQPRDRSLSPESTSIKELHTTSTTKRGSTTSTTSGSTTLISSRTTTEQSRDRSYSPEGKPRTNTTTRRVEQVDSTTGHGKPPVKPRDRSASPAQQRRTTSGSTTTVTTTRSGTTGPRGNVPSSPDRRGSKPSPIWADRTKVLRGAGTPTAPTTPRKGSTGKTTRTTTSSSSTTSSSNLSSSTTKRREEDSITSSYGVGPTDENGLPLFGIRALKKKMQPAASSETKQEVTGYVIEEQFYSDDKSPPRHERKELIYSSNPDELATLQQQLERKSLTDSSDVKVERQFKQITGTGDAIDTQLAIGDASERFIRKESNSSSSHHSHLQSQFESQIEHELTADETEDSESNDVCSVIEVEQPQLRQTSSSTTSRSSATRSFLNTSGEDRHVSGVDDVLERMRNADNVVEPGDSAEDSEARALLNKFLGASVIMQGVESMLPVGQRQQSQNRSNGSSSNSQAVKTTRISSSYSSKTGNNSNTISSSSTTTSNTGTINNSNNSNSSSNRKLTSSAPVTRTTCDIEEIWDEQLLRQLLEQASTYEERRKIRARLRELMAEREAQHKQQSSTTSERTETKSKDGGAVVTTTTTKVTTRTVSGSAAAKNISPLAKFKQLDKAAAQQQAQKTSK